MAGFKRFDLLSLILGILVSVLLVAAYAQAATTISTDIQTDGMLSVTGTTTLAGNVGISTTTPGSLLSLNNVANFTVATSTFYSTGGINLAGGCFALNGTCVGAGSGSQWTTTGSNIYYTTGNVYIGTTSAQSIGDGTPKFDLLPSSGASILNVQANNSFADIQGVSYRNSGTTHVVLDGWAYRGTQAAPLAIIQNDAVTSVRAEAYDGTPGTGGNGDGTNEIATMDMVADENQSTTAQGGAFWFSTTNGNLLDQAQVNNGFATSSAQDNPDSRLYIGSNGNIGLGTGSINCALNTTCFINEDVAHDFPTQVYFGSTNGGFAYYGGAANISYSTKVVMVPGTNQGTIPVLTVGGSAATTTFSASGNVGVGSSTPVANFQVANGNATTTAEFGSAGQTKGSCLKLYRTDGSAIYAYVAAGATTFTLTTTACATVTNF